MSAFDDPIPFGVWYFALPCSNENCEGTIPLAIQPRPDKPVPLMRALRRQIRLKCGDCHQLGAAASGEIGRIDLSDGTTFTFSIPAAAGLGGRENGPDSMPLTTHAAAGGCSVGGLRLEGAERTGNSTR